MSANTIESDSTSKPEPEAEQHKSGRKLAKTDALATHQVRQD